MIRVLPKSAKQPNKMVFTIYNSISRKCLRWWESGNWEIYQVPAFRSKHGSKRRNRTTRCRKSKISERILRKITVSCDFQQQFPVFFLLNGKHPREHPFFERALGSTETQRTTHRGDWVRIKGKTTNKPHSGFKLKMAAFQFLLRRARNFDTILHRSSLFGNKIACNIRCISQGKIYDFKLEQKMFGKVGFTTRLND